MFLRKLCRNNRFIQIKYERVFPKYPLSLPIINPDDYENKHQKTIKAVRGYWFIEIMNTMAPPIKGIRINNK